MLTTERKALLLDALARKAGSSRKSSAGSWAYPRTRSGETFGSLLAKDYFNACMAALSPPPRHSKTLPTRRNVSVNDKAEISQGRRRHGQGRTDRLPGWRHDDNQARARLPKGLKGDVGDP